MQNCRLIRPQTLEQIGPMTGLQSGTKTMGAICIWKRSYQPEVSSFPGAKLDAHVGSLESRPWMVIGD